MGCIEEASDDDLGDNKKNDRVTIEDKIVEL